MPVEVRTCTSELLPALIVLEDEEFIASRGREVSLIQRFPGVYDMENLKNLYLVTVDNNIAAAAGVKQFEWHASSRVLHGTMIGGVVAAPFFRRRGYATAILRAIEVNLCAAGIDFAVLWATVPAFYRSLGWMELDTGLFGELQELRVEKNQFESVRLDLAATPTDYFEQLRHKWLSQYIVRRPADYATLPIPAKSMELYVALQNGQWLTYALVGRNKDVGFVYEVVGDPSSWGSIFTKITDEYSQIYINAFLGNPLAAWLGQHTRVDWRLQTLAMWRIFSTRLDWKSIRSIEVPYLDRI